MQCTLFRQIVGAEPAHESAGGRGSSRRVPRVRRYARQMQHLDGLLKRALEVSGAQTSPAVVRAAAASRQRWSRRSWYAMAAGVAMAVAIGFTVWLSAPSPLSRGRPDRSCRVRRRTRCARRTSESTRDGSSACSTAPASLSIRWRQTFRSHRPVRIRGGRAPHLVVQTASGPVTVIVLPKERIEAAQNFDEQGYKGVLLPSGPGSVAVIAKDAPSCRTRQPASWQRLAGIPDHERHGGRRSTAAGRHAQGQNKPEKTLTLPHALP